MKKDRTAVLALASLGTFFAVGVPYRHIPYAKLSLPDSLPGYGIVVAIAAFSRLVFRIPFFQAFSAVGIAIPACVMARTKILSQLRGMDG